MKVTIITVCWNSQTTIEDTLKSVLAQSYQDIEYILIDGQSTDSTLIIIKKYEKLFNGRLKWITESDRGIYDAINKGISMATGKLIGIINSDDWYEVDAVKLAVDQYQKVNNMCIISGNMNLRKFNKDFIRIQYNKDVNSHIYQCMPINHPATFVPKCVYDEIGVFDIQFKLSADYDFIFRACNKKIPFLFVDQVIANMRLGGATNGRGAKGLRNGFISAKEDYLLRFKNTGKNFRILYYKQIFILKIRQLKRTFIASKYD